MPPQQQNRLKKHTERILRVLEEKNFHSVRAATSVVFEVAREQLQSAVVARIFLNIFFCSVLSTY
jgi:hypothetical protein